MFCTPGDSFRPSNSVNTIAGAFRELSDSIIAKQKSGVPCPKVVIKMIYDRGSWEQLFNSHASVKPEGWEVLDIPKQEELPGIELEVVVSVVVVL